MSEETTKRVNYHKNGNLPLFYIEKDTRGGVLYAPFACAKDGASDRIRTYDLQNRNLMLYPTKLRAHKLKGKLKIHGFSSFIC